MADSYNNAVPVAMERWGVEHRELAVRGGFSTNVSWTCYLPIRRCFFASRSRALTIYRFAIFLWGYLKGTVPETGVRITFVWVITVSDSHRGVHKQWAV